jgi:hypothetical protein
MNQTSAELMANVLLLGRLTFRVVLMKFDIVAELSVVKVAWLTWPNFA